MAPVGSLAANDPGQDLSRRKEMFGSKHEAVPIVGDILKELANERGEIFDGIGVVFENQKRADVLGNRRFENRAMGKEAAPGAGAFVPTGRNADGRTALPPARLSMMPS